MKTTDHFKRMIQMYLEQRAAEDALFAKNYRNPAKNIDDCVTYILNYVQKSGCNGFTDGEIYGQAVHYYDENEIEVGKPIQCQIAVNHVVELTAEEKAEARQNAIRQYQDEEVRRSQNRNKPKTAYFLSVSMMADKESSKETSVPIYDSIHKKQVLIMETIRQNGEIILHSDDGTGMKMIFQKPHGQKFSRSGICGVYPAYRNRRYGIFARHH